MACSHQHCVCNCLEGSWHYEAGVQRCYGAPLHGVIVETFGQCEALQDQTHSDDYVVVMHSSRLCHAHLPSKPCISWHALIPIKT